MSLGLNNPRHPIEHSTQIGISMQAGATPGPEDRLSFANQLAEVRDLDIKGKYKKRLDKLEAAYQFILLQSLDRFHKEMLRAQLPGKLHLIKEKLCDTTPFSYVTNLPFSSWNWNIKHMCRHCNTNTLKAQTVFKRALL